MESVTTETSPAATLEESPPQDADQQTQRGEAAAVDRSPEPAPAPVGSANVAEYDYHEAYNQIAELEKDAAEAKADWESLKESTAEAKKFHDAAVERLCRKIRDYRPGNAPLFDQAVKSPPIEQAVTPFSTPTEAPALDESWKAVLIEQLEPKLKPGKLKALAENTPPILTIGGLMEWQAKKGDFWAKDIKGLGDGGQEQLVAALDAYWASHPIGGDTKASCGDGRWFGRG